MNPRLRLVLLVGLLGTRLLATGWPLTPMDVAHPLGNNWGEFQNYGGDSYFHNGIDVFPDTIGQGVHAVASGWVKAWGTTQSSLHYRLAVSDSPMARTARTTGWLYAHIDASRWHKSVGDPVVEGELIGYLVPWPITGFDHTHFARISDTGATWSRFPSPTWWFIQNPLTILTPVVDTTKPTFENARSSYRFAFCRNNTSTYFSPVADTLKGDVDVIARLYDRINPYTNSSIWNRMIPQTLTWSIRGRYKSQAETLGMTVKYVEPPIGAREINVVYKDDATCNTVGDYDARTYYFIVTNTDGDSVIEMADTSGRWRTTDYPDTSYWVKVTAIDASGNQHSDSQQVTTANNLRNVGCTNLVSPVGTIDSGTAVIPACSVYNYGTTFATYSIRMKVGTGYNATASITRHIPGQYLHVTFPAWTASPTGTFSVSCSTEYTGDNQPANNRRFGTVVVRQALADDVGATHLLAPVGIIDSGTVLTPACSVYNFGTQAENYNVRMKVGTGYEATAAVGSQVPGTRVRVTFPSYTASVPGSHAVTCSTELSGDANPANDRQSGSFISAVHDVGASAVVAPTGTVDSGLAVVPQAVVVNTGNVTENFAVRFTIGASYRDSQLVSLGAGSIDTVSFANWFAAPVGILVTSCSTLLFRDRDHGNDRTTDSVRVIPQSGIADAGPKLPGAFVLEPPEPNPCHEQVRIRCALPRASYIDLGLYTATGRRVQTLLRGACPAGRYAATAFLRALPAGVYYCRLQSAEFTAARKVMRLE